MKTYYYKMVAVSAIIATCFSCERATEAVSPNKIETAVQKLSVELARQIYEAEQANQTRSAMENLTPFAVGDPVLCWEQAEISSSDLISSVDVPITGQRQYKVIRYDENGEAYIVDAHSKIIVVQSNETQEIQTFIRVCIPDAGYDTSGSENISNRTLNCEDRGDYTGLEYYATLEGFPAAISRYEEGEMICGLYFFDDAITRKEKVRIFAQLLGNTRIIPIDNTRSLMDGDWDYMHNHYHGELFIANDGQAYVYVDADGNGVVDSYILFVDYLVLYCEGSSGGGGSTGGNSGGSNGDGSGGNPGSGTTPGGDNSGGNGDNGSGGGSGGGTGDGSGGDSDNDNEDASGDSVIPGDGSNLEGNEIFNPLPEYPSIGDGSGLWNPRDSLPAGGGIIIPPKDEDEEEEEDEETRLGREGIQKMISDLESGNVQMYECTITDNIEALITAADVGMNTNGIIASCLTYIQQSSQDIKMIKKFGEKFSVLGLGVSFVHTIILFSDGEISTADSLNAISTALSGIGCACAFLGAPPVGAALGIAGCLVGLASNFFTYHYIYGSEPKILHVKTASDQNIYILIA